MGINFTWSMAKLRQDISKMSLPACSRSSMPRRIDSWRMAIGTTSPWLSPPTAVASSSMEKPKARGPGPAWTKTDAPARGSALVFNGSDDHLRVPKFGLSAPTNDITVEFWLRSGSVNEQVLFSLEPDLSGNRIAARIVPNDGEVYWEFGNSLAEGRLLDPSSNWLTGSWQHFALISSNSANAMRLYHNGALEASKSGAEN